MIRPPSLLKGNIFGPKKPVAMIDRYILYPGFYLENKVNH